MNTPRAPQSDVVSTLLEAAQAAKGTLPPPKPGTHESDLLAECQPGPALRGVNRDGVTRGGVWENLIASAWSRANNHATQEIDLEPVIGLEFDYLGRKSTQEANQ